jgi:hypothetical protein
MAKKKEKTEPKRKRGGQPKAPREKTRQMALRIGPEFDAMFELMGRAMVKMMDVKISNTDMAKMMMRAGFGVYADKFGIDLKQVEAMLDEKFGEVTKTATSAALGGLDGASIPKKPKKA